MQVWQHWQLWMVSKWWPLKVISVSSGSVSIPYKMYMWTHINFLSCLPLVQFSHVSSQHKEILLFWGLIGGFADSKNMSSTPRAQMLSSENYRDIFQTPHVCISLFRLHDERPHLVIEQWTRGQCELWSCVHGSVGMTWCDTDSGQCCIMFHSSGVYMCFSSPVKPKHLALCH